MTSDSDIEMALIKIQVMDDRIIRLERENAALRVLLSIADEQSRKRRF